METKITIHKCFQCHYSNKFYNLPYYVKGKKCKRCHKYNFFNSHTKTIRKKTNTNINNNNNRIIVQSNLGQMQQIMNRLNIENNNIPIHNFNQDNHHINMNYMGNNSLNQNYYHNNIINDNRILYSWLKKEKFTNETMNKYGNDNICPICLEAFQINENIHISKCNHLFHYKCIETSITKNTKDCPMCRCNLQDGSKKQIINRNIDNRIYLDFYYNLNRNNIYNNSNENNNRLNNRNRYASIRSDNNNHNFGFFAIICNFLRNIFRI